LLFYENITLQSYSRAQVGGMIIISPAPDNYQVDVLPGSRVAGACFYCCLKQWLSAFASFADAHIKNKNARKQQQGRQQEQAIHIWYALVAEIGNTLYH